jgi:hypothetical protein
MPFYSCQKHGTKQSISEHLCLSGMAAGRANMLTQDSLLFWCPKDEFDMVAKVSGRSLKGVKILTILR